MYGKLVRLRPVELDDQKFLTELNSDPSVRSNVVGWSFPQSEHWQTEWFRTSKPTDSHRWIVDVGDESPIGMTGLWDVDWHNRHAKTALKIGGPRNQRGKGFGRDAIKAVMAFAFYDVGLQRLHTTILEDNIPSLRAYQTHCNWKIEGVARSHVWRHGDFKNLLHLGVLREEFDALPDAEEYVAMVRNGPPVR